MAKNSLAGGCFLIFCRRKLWLRAKGLTWLGNAVWQWCRLVGGAVDAVAAILRTCFGQLEGDGNMDFEIDSGVSCILTMSVMSAVRQSPPGTCGDLSCRIELKVRR